MANFIKFGDVSIAPDCQCWASDSRLNFILVIIFKVI